MDRKQAQSHIGTCIIVDERELGRYFGILLDVIIEPRKPWRGLVRITAVDELPKQSMTEDDTFVLTKPLYSEGEIKEFPSTKIKKTNAPNTDEYESSLINSITREIETIKYTNDQNNIIVNGLVQYLHDVEPLVAQIYLEESESDDDLQYVYYTAQKDNGQLKLFDRVSQQFIALNDCPFQFELKMNSQWQKGRFHDAVTFETIGGKRYPLLEQQAYRLDRSQLEPYQILVNELEKPALDALEKSLETLGLSHEDVTYCHNSLLIKLLYSENEKKFQGVNFITYQNTHQTVMVQHHFKRMLQEGTDDVYDRFEMTDDQGKRLIATYNSFFNNR